MERNQKTTPMGSESSEHLSSFSVTPSTVPASETDTDLPRQFVSQAGLTVVTTDDTWLLAPRKIKGHSIDVAWLNRFPKDSKLRFALLDTLIHYAETSSPGTTVTVAFAVANGFPNDNDDESAFLRTWNGLGNSTRKTLKGFLSKCVKTRQHKNLEKHRVISQQFKHKQDFQALHPTKGRLTDYELDSILQNVRARCEEVLFEPGPWDELDLFTTYSSFNGNITRFSTVRGLMGYRLMLQIARRPGQIRMLKWCDVLPLGQSFKERIDSPIYTGARELHIRCFRIKQSNLDDSFRNVPEKYSIPLSEHFSLRLIRYREIYAQGIKLALENSGLEPTVKEIESIVQECPLVPDLDLFKADFSEPDTKASITSPNSQAFHVTEAQMKTYSTYYGTGHSDRMGSVVGSNNRLRHTWLCNAAMSGKSISEISRITNVTLPAARYYLQLGLKDRQFIDENYGANEFLRTAFEPKACISDEDRVIKTSLGESVGVEKDGGACSNCEHKRRLARPVPCYGCPSFRPFLEGDHKSILNEVLAKREFTKKYGKSDVYAGSTKRLDRAIAFIKLTIDICQEHLVQKKDLGSDHD